MNRALVIIAVVAFLLALGLTAFADDPDPKVIESLLFGGLASFSASFLPW